jgi:hypothetical protein
MKIILITIVLSLFSTQFANAQSRIKSKRKYKKPMVVKIIDVSECLPAGITLQTVVSTKDLGFDTVTMTRKVATINVKETLAKLGGRCVSGKLVDKAGKEIRFYNLQGCWGNPPADYLEILETQTKEIADLKKKFTVVELTCNPSGGMIQ